MKIYEKIKTELRTREVNKYDIYGIVGVEIKARRTSLSNTLAMLSDNICSVSYLSKVENSKITPNRELLRKLCLKLDIPEEEIYSMLESKHTLDKISKAYFINDLDAVTNEYLSNKNLNNYRYKIIELIYKLSLKQLYDCNILASELMTLISTMCNYDLIVFTIFYSILCFYNQQYEETMKILELMRKKVREHTILDLLCNRYYFYTLFKLENPSINYIFYQYCQKLMEEGYHYFLDDMYYIYGIYLLRNKSFIEYRDIYKRIYNKKYKRSLAVMAKFLFNSEIKESDLDNTCKFFYYLGMIKIDKKRVEKEIDQLNDSDFDIDFDLLVLKYLLLEDSAKKYSYICLYALPNIEISNNGFHAKFFLSELSKLCTITNRYKIFNEAYKKVMRIK